MNSFNHYAYGAVGDWMYEVVAGIDVDPSAPGYKHILIQPQPGGGWTHAKATHTTMYGNVSSDWQISNDKFSLSVEVPANTRATVRLPNAKLDEVTESNRTISTDKTLVANQDSNAVVVKVGSGKYLFAYPWK